MTKTEKIRQTEQTGKEANQFCIWELIESTHYPRGFMWTVSCSTKTKILYNNEYIYCPWCGRKIDIEDGE